MNIQLIKDSHDRICILGESTQRPSDAWFDNQTIPMSRSGRYHSAYPITGGSVVVNADSVEYIAQQPTQHQLDEVLGLNHHPFNPAASVVLKIITG